jgi:single-stranded-DNA-specific exonuclease
MHWNILHTIDSLAPKQRRRAVLAAIFQSRGLTNPAIQKEFLHPSDPLNLTLDQVGIDPLQVKTAIEHIHQAVAANTPIIVYGDYDADGITATAILWEALHQLGAQVTPFIPSRELHGYGLSIKGIEDALTSLKSSKTYSKNQSPLIITVDNGVVAHQAASFCHANHIDLIITDHHQLTDAPPDCLALVHSTQIAGSAVAWMLVKELSPELAQLSLDLVTIGTVADMLPLTGPNRSIVKAGLKALRSTKRVGLYVMYEGAGIDDDEVFSTYHINYIIAPRLNAMGRLKHALDSLRLLCTTDYARAQVLAQVLTDTNTTRQSLTLEYVTLAETLVKDSQAPIIVIDHPDFHEGVIGLVAGKLAETYYRPSLVISRGSETSKGSARSVKGVNIINLIREHDNLLINAGGHPMAAGFSIETKKIEAFKQSLLQTATKKINPEKLVASLTIDVTINITDVTDDLFYQLEELKPFGTGNRQPVFCSYQVRILEAKALGKDNNHLRLSIQTPEGTHLSAIGFNLAQTPAAQTLINTPSPHADIAYTIDENIWNGRRSLQLKLKDVKTE